MKKFGVLSGIGELYLSDLGKDGEVKVKVSRSTNSYMIVSIPILRLEKSVGYSEDERSRFMEYVTANAHAMLREVICK